MWTSEQIEAHKEAARRLLKIKDSAFEYIRKNKNVTELEVQKFIYEKFKEFGLKTADQPQIVAFGSDSAVPHYYPTEKSNKTLRRGDVIKIDIWAKLKKKSASYADITWMGYCGKNIPKKVEGIFNIVIQARDEGIKCIRKRIKRREMPRGTEVDKVVRDYIHSHGHGGKFIHGTGHSLGFMGPHGSRTRLNRKGKSFLRTNVAYTIEPGIYIDGEFGMRSETDFYVSDDFKLVLTADLQKKIIKIR